MPLVYQQDINLQSKLAVWHIQESEHFFLSSVKSPARTISNPQKLLQHLAGRFLLNHLQADFPFEKIEVIESGRPMLKEHRLDFSITHSGGYAAAVIASDSRVGIDLEIFSERAARVCNRFLSEAEQQVIRRFISGNDAIQLWNKWATAAWTIKETLYKWQGIAGVDFIKNLEILNIQCVSDHFQTECMIRGSKSLQVQVSVHFFEDYCLSYLVK